MSVPKGNHSWIFIGSTDAEAPILWPPDAENWLSGKDPDFWERLKAGGRGDNRGWDGITDLMDMSLSKLWEWWWTGKPGVLQRVAKSQTQLRDWTELNVCSWSFSLFWRLSETNIATPAFFWLMLAWRRKWQPTPVFLPGESQGWGSLVGCRLWGRTEADTTEAT